MNSTIINFTGVVDFDDVVSEIYLAVEDAMFKRKPDIKFENDGIGPYEYWGQKCVDKGKTYAVIDDDSRQEFLIYVEGLETKGRIYNQFFQELVKDELLAMWTEFSVTSPKRVRCEEEVELVAVPVKLDVEVSDIFTDEKMYVKASVRWKENY